MSCSVCRYIAFTPKYRKKVRYRRRDLDCKLRLGWRCWPTRARRGVPCLPAKRNAETEGPALRFEIRAAGVLSVGSGGAGHSVRTAAYHAVFSTVGSPGTVETANPVFHLRPRLG